MHCFSRHLLLKSDVEIRDASCSHDHAAGSEVLFVRCGPDRTRLLDLDACRGSQWLPFAA